MWAEQTGTRPHRPLGVLRMSVRADRVSKVIIAGNWFTVQPGTFEVVDLGFTDEVGNPLHDEDLGKGYHFVTDNGDEYVGRLESIELYKLILR